MNIWISLVTGIIIGWVVEWVVDWLYWRRGLEALYRTETELRYELTQVKQDYQDALTKIAELSNRLPESQLDASPLNTPDQLEADDSTDGRTEPVDDLTVIRGIGSSTERKLMDAQITTFETLGDASSQALAEILGDDNADYEAWIAQARGLAREKAKT